MKGSFQVAAFSFQMGLAAVAGAQEATTTTAYVYVEPFELRLEIVIPANRLTPPGNNLIDASVRQQLLERWTNELRETAAIKADGQPAKLELDRIDFVRADAEGIAPDDRDPVAVEEAMIEAIFVQARDGFPNELELTWKFSLLGGDDAVRVNFEASGAGETTEIYQKALTYTPDTATQTWTKPNGLIEPALIEATLPQPFTWSSSAVGAAAFAVLAVVFFLCSQKWPSFRFGAVLLCGLCVISAIFCGLFAMVDWEAARRRSNPDKATVVKNLIANIYHAFDYRQESRIYDTLAVSVDGPLLENLYLDIQRSLELEEDGGRRVRVSKVKLEACQITAASPGFEADAAWTTSGSVSHAGHLHRRQLWSHAQLRIEPRDGRWKVVEIEILEENRK